MPIMEQVYSFRKGEAVHLDTIYELQGIGGNDWWEPSEKDEDICIITRSIDITIKIRTW